jgi:hypothetical protein
VSFVQDHSSSIPLSLNPPREIFLHSHDGEEEQIQSKEGRNLNINAAIQDDQFLSALPKAKTTLAASTTLGYYAKAIIVYGKLWWRDIGLRSFYFVQRSCLVLLRYLR